MSAAERRPHERTAPQTPARKSPFKVPPFTDQPCPDCGASFDDQKRLLHADTCPLGRSLDESREADRLWFQRHPHATEYRRPPAACDRDAVLRSLPLGAKVVGGYVRVVQLAPGVRVRDYRHVVAAGPEVTR